VRNLFLALLLANLLFAGWRYWIAPPEVPARQFRAPGREPEIRAAATPRAASQPAPRPPAFPSPAGPPAGEPAVAQPAATPGSAAGGACTRIGPIADGQIADSLRAGLVGRGIQAGTVAEDGQVWVGHWVQLEGVQTREEADRMAARLAAGGLPDAYVFQSTPPFTVSLGVFRDKDKADRVAAAATALGFRPQVTDRYRSGTQYWLVLPTVPAADLRLDEMSRQTGQILRTEAVACRAAPVGATGGIN
jgi:cell division protein FtsN